jgi:hypothetical protein
MSCTYAVRRRDISHLCACIRFDMRQTYTRTHEGAEGALFVGIAFVTCKLAWRFAERAKLHLEDRVYV